MKSMRSNGDAGAKEPILANPGLLGCGLKIDKVEDFEVIGARGNGLEPRRARDRRKEGIEAEEEDSRNLAVVGESLGSMDTSLSSAYPSSGLVRRFNLLLVLVILLENP
jgi:hypothetical protein